MFIGKCRAGDAAEIEAVSGGQCRDSGAQGVQNSPIRQQQAGISKRAILFDFKSHRFIIRSRK